MDERGDGKSKKGADVESMQLHWDPIIPRKGLGKFKMI